MNTNRIDDYEQYEQLFDSMKTDRRARRKRKPRIKHEPKKDQRAIVDELAETVGLEGGFTTTYTPSRHEEGWLLESLRSFYAEAYITDVLALVKGGKEASVYRCAAHQSVDVPLLAAKVYRPRMFRQLRNDKMYRQGRAILTDGGREVRGNEDRILRAINKKTTFGQQVTHESWLLHEIRTLRALYDAGLSVPVPYAASSNAILMSYIGGEHIGAPTLNEIALEQDEAEALFQKVMWNIETMLQHDIAHGDLSAYNILYWEGDITLIDFPQVINVKHNDQAHFILSRDIARVCDYFAQQGVACDAETIMRDLWQRYVERDPEEVAADLSRLFESEE